MVDLVVDRVEDHPNPCAGPLAERGIDFLKAMRRDRDEHAIELRGGLVPALQDVRLRRWLRLGPLPPFARRDTARDRHRHAEHLASEIAERTHAADGIRK